MKGKVVRQLEVYSVRYVVYDSSLLSLSCSETSKGQLMTFSRPFAAMCAAAGSCEWASGRG